MSDTKFLSEVDKLILKLDEIIIGIQGKEGAIDYKNVKDGFDKLRFKISENLKEAETLLNSRDKILNSTVPKEIYERKTIEQKLESLLDNIDKQLKELNIELKAQKKKSGKYVDLSKKEKMKTLMEEKFQLLRSKLDGIQVEESKVEDNRSSMEKLEEILNQESGNNQQERELTAEEKDKMNEWKEEIARQDQDLEEVGDIVKQLKSEVRKANDNIEGIGKTVKKLNKKTDKVKTHVDSQNKKLKDLIGKLRSGDKLCMDIILILVALGLIAVLYNVIKRKVMG